MCKSCRRLHVLDMSNQRPSSVPQYAFLQLCADSNEFLLRVLLQHLIAHEQRQIESLANVGVQVDAPSRRQRRRLWQMHRLAASPIALERFLGLRQVCRRWRNWFDGTLPRVLPVGVLCVSCCMAPYVRGQVAPLHCWPPALINALRQSSTCRSVVVCMASPRRRTAAATAASAARYSTAISILYVTPASMAQPYCSHPSRSFLSHWASKCCTRLKRLWFRLV